MHSHVERISLHREGEATLDLGIFRIRIRILQRAAGQDSFLVVVERYRAKLLPVRHQ